jgi:hypothetical protein
MRVLRLPGTFLVAALLGAGVVACSQTIEGAGTVAEGVVTAGPSPTDTGSPTETGSPTGSPTPTGTSAPTPTPTTNPITVRRRVLCVLEQASITSINSQFHKSKVRATQIRVLRTGAATITGQINRSGLPTADRIRASGQAVVNQLNGLVRAANGGGTPSTGPYNTATRNFQKACTTVS